MKKGFKIVLYIVAGIIFIVFALWLTRNIFLTGAIEKLVTKETKGKVKLEINQLNFNFLSKTISIDSLAIDFDSVYLDKEKHTSFEQINFSEVKLEGFSLSSLLLRNMLVAKRLVFVRPGVIITTDGIKKKKVKDPKKLLSFIEHSSGNNFGILAKIGSIELQYGQVEILDANDPEIKFSTESFTIFLDHFNTSDKKRTSGRMFFSNSLYLKIEKMYKSFAPGYALAIDSLTWFSGKYNLEAYGINLVPMAGFPDSLSIMNIQAKSLLMNNFHLKNEDSLNKATVQKLILNSGIVSVKTAKPNINKQKKTKNEIPLFQLISADTVILNHNHLLIKDFQGDTVLSFYNLDLTLQNIVLDSAYLNNPKEHLKYGFFKFNTEFLISKKFVPNAYLQSKNVSYSSKREKFVLDEFKISENSGAYYFHSGRVKLNLSLKKLIKNRFQKVDAFIISPYLEINLEKLSQQKQSENKKEKPKISIEPGNIHIVNGTIRAVLSNGIDKIKVNDASMLANNFKFNKEEQLLEWDTLALKTALISYSKQKDFIAAAGSMQFDGNNLILNNINFANEKKALKSFSAQKLRIESFNLSQLLFNKKFNVKSLSLQEPNINLEINSKAKEKKTDSLFSIAKIVADIEKEGDFTVDIKNLSIEDGSTNIKFLKSDTVSGIHTNFKLQWKNVRFAHKFDKPISNLSGLEFELWDSYYYGNGLRTNIGKMSLKSDNGFLGFENIAIVHNDSSLTKKMKINDATLKYIGFRNFDFQNLFSHDHIYFDKLLMDGLNIDMIQHKQKKQEVIDLNYTPYQFDLKAELPFDLIFDTVEVKNTHINYVLKDSLSTTQIGVGDFKFMFTHDNESKGKSLNTILLIKGSAFQLDSLKISNEQLGFAFDIDHLKLNPDNNSLFVTGIGFNKEKSEKSQRTNIDIDTLALSGISITNTMPSSIKLNRLWASNTNLFIQHQKTNSTKSINDTTLKMAGLYRYSKLFNLIGIDTVLFSDVDVNYLNADSTKKHLSVNDIKLMVSEIKIFPELALDTIPVKFDNIYVELNNRKFITNDSLYEINAKRLSYNYNNQTFQIDSLSMTPLLDTTQFFEKHYWQTERVNLFSPKISFGGFDLNEWNKNGLLRFKKVSLDNIKTYLYRDKTYPRDSLIRPLLQGMLRKVKQPFVIDTLLVNNSYIWYAQKDIKSDNPGYIYLTDFNLKGVNLTNVFTDDGALTKLFVDFKLMGTGKLNASFYFPLMRSQESQFWFTLKTDKLDLTNFNPILENLTGITILRGKGSIDIPLVTANDTLAIGHMLFRYKRLKVSLYNRKKAKQMHGIGSPFVKFILNDLVLRSNNPNWFRKPRVGIVYFNRNRNKSIVNFVVKSTLSGIISTLGFNNKEQRKHRKEYRKIEFDIQRKAVKEEKYTGE